MSMPFIDQLAAAVKAKKNPVLVGLDPRLNQLPSKIRDAFPTETPEGQADAFEAFCRGVIDAVAPLVPVVKPQAAFFEELGPAGMFALAKVISYAQEKGLLVILDGKRNDIGSTAQAYARGMLGRGQSPWNADALTVSPYLGDDSLTPFIDAAVERNAGIFVLVKTSNPGGAMLQDLKTESGETIYRKVAAFVEGAAAETATVSGYGAVGAVVGATWPAQLEELRTAMPHTWFLVPGFGSQGGTAADVAGAFDENGLGAVVNNSRGILFAYQKEPYADRFGESQWQAACEAAVQDMIAQLATETPAGRL
jgi:orotidine-5'-phosphate decarboxylase